MDYTGYVYVIQGDHGIHKIGLTASPRIRLDAIRKHSAMDLRIAALYAAYEPRPLEQHLHSVFASQRLFLEWFRLDAADLAVIEQIAVDDFSALPTTEEEAARAEQAARDARKRALRGRAAARTDLPEPLLIPAEVATELKMNEQTVRRYLRHGAMIGIRLAGNHWRIEPSELRRFLAEGPIREVQQ